MVTRFFARTFPAYTSRIPHAESRSTVITPQPEPGLISEPHPESQRDPLAGAPHPLPDGEQKAANDGCHLPGLMLGALGVVFGDIGTSPLYALRQTVLATEGGLANHVAV